MHIDKLNICRRVVDKVLKNISTFLPKYAFARKIVSNRPKMN